MTDNDFKRALDDVVPPAPAALDTLHGSQRRAMKRRQMHRRSIGAAALVTVLGSATLTQVWPADERAAPGGPAVTAPAQVLELTCTGEGATLSGEIVTATSQGVVVQVRSGAPIAEDNKIFVEFGSDSNDRWPGLRTVPSAGGRVTLPIPPGQSRIDCSFEDKEIADAAPHNGPTPITVEDPAGHWQAGDPAQLLSCGDQWGRGGLRVETTTPSPESAARQVTDALGLTLGEFQEGYPDGDERSYLARDGDTPVAVIRARQLSSRDWDAGLYASCPGLNR